jgi:hypothetical protein
MGDPLVAGVFADEVWSVFAVAGPCFTALRYGGGVGGLSAGWPRVNPGLVTEVGAGVLSGLRAGDLECCLRCGCLGDAGFVPVESWFEAEESDDRSPTAWGLRRFAGEDDLRRDMLEIGPINKIGLIVSVKINFRLQEREKFLD